MHKELLELARSSGKRMYREGIANGAALRSFL